MRGIIKGAELQRSAVIHIISSNRLYYYITIQTGLWGKGWLYSGDQLYIKMLTVNWGGVERVRWGESWPPVPVGWGGRP